MEQKAGKNKPTFQELAGDDLDRLKRSAKFNPLLDYYKSGHSRGTERQRKN